VRRAGSTPTPSDALREGVAAIAVDGLDVLDGPTWDSEHGRWVLRCRITIRPAPDSRVPTRTTWCVLIDEAYPSGRITIYPATLGGVTETFPHQNHNRPGPTGRAWRTGDICVHQGSRALGRLGGSAEPLESRRRLAWRLARAVDWVQAASCGTLVGTGDPFELPDFGGSLSEVVAFSEDRSSYRIWQAAGAPTMGTAELYCQPNAGKGFSRTVVRVYRSVKGETFYEPIWGKAFDPPSPSQIEVGIWVRLPDIPHAPPWGRPETWGELVECVARAGIDLDALVAGASWRLRDAPRSLLLCGFPMPARVGEANVEYFWQALKLPRLTRPDGPLPGFRNTERNRRLVDRITRFRRDASLSWLHSENWHPSTRAARGRFSDALTRRRVLLIGGGALGSVVAELLVRGGLERLTISEGDFTRVGNLARHTPTPLDVGREKATGLADRLNQASPHARVDVFNTFPPTKPGDTELARRADLIIECTGEDEVALAMGAFDWGGDKLFCSISLDWEARRLFSFLARGPVFPAGAFLAAVGAHVDGDPEKAEVRELAREGVGCWHPVMPARVDDVWMLAATAVADLDQALASGRDGDGLVVFERDEARPFGGVRRAS